ncbi:MAG TPA: IclR family transcriptional regulator [Firmicutes bacterium]|nr:IclR family transcriptional regulator [Bacillota bacterium]
MPLGKLTVTAKKPEKRYSAPVLYKAFAILEEIAIDQHGLGISDLARKLNMSKGTVHGIIQAFLDLGAIRENTHKKFRLGPLLIKLGNMALDGEDLRIMSRPYMEELYKEFGETIFLGTFDGRRATIIDKVEKPYALKISAPIGAKIPLLAGATGKIFLSSLEEEDIQRLLAKKSFTKFNQDSFANAEDFLKEIKKVKKQGFATDYEEYLQGVNAVSVPIKDSYGRIAAAIWMVGFSSAFDAAKIERAKEAMIAAAKKISHYKE